KVAGLNLTECLIDIVANANATQNLAGLLNGDGHPVSNASDATSISYAMCTSVCGTGPEPFRWSLFSQDLGAWLLPNLALISQLPFGARYRLDNFMSAALTIGSPALAGYSLFLTLLDSAWINRQFDQLEGYPNSRIVVSILGNLQQVPLSLDFTRVHSFVSPPENDRWLQWFSEFVDYTHTWSIASATAIVWVVVAYVISVVNSPADFLVNYQSDGDATGSLWLWLIPIVVGWLQFSPKCDFDRLQQAYRRADRHARAAAGHMGTSTASTRRALTIIAKEKDVSSPDELLTPPIFNYSRSLRWASIVDGIYLAFEAEEASKEAQNRTPVSFPIPTQKSESFETLPLNYPLKSSEETPRVPQRNHWAPGVFTRMFAASCASLILQWGTVGAAFMMAWFTPTTRIGCRAMSYLIYGVLSTIIWFMLLISSILAHYTSDDDSNKQKPARYLWARAISNCLRWMGKTLAVANSIWVVVACTFVYSGLYDTCFCNSSEISRGKAAYVVIVQTAAQTAQLKTAWIGAVGMACTSALFFLGLVNIKLPDTRPSPS
ncbi:hypothetical protein DEU56DRAFT_954381, partial [Suillus clintonianus]|uniref:uncharacterized protein n=1 Tax=Suillus clintonianus TaxID=1904413 RepID=UPI001B8731D0